MNHHLHIDIAALKAAIADLLASHPELAEDEVLRADTFEAQTSIDTVLAELVEIEADAGATAEALKQRIETMSARKARYERRQTAIRTLIHSILDRAGLNKFTLPEATLSVSYRKPTPFILNDEALPDECCKIERKGSLTKIKEWLETHKTLPAGVGLSNGKSTLSIRRA